MSQIKSKPNWLLTALICDVPMNVLTPTTRLLLTLKRLKCDDSQARSGVIGSSSI